MSTHRRRSVKFYQLATVLLCASLSGFACSKRNPKIDTAAPATKPSSTGGSDGSDSIYIPPNSGTTSGNNNVTPPSNNTTTGGNDSVTPPSNNTTTGGNDSVTPPSNNTTTGGSDSVTPPSNNTTGGSDSNNNDSSNNDSSNNDSSNTTPGGSDSINNDSSNSNPSPTEAQVVAKVVMTARGPQVEAKIPSDATDLRVTYKSISGSLAGTTAIIDLGLRRGSKTCSITNATVTLQETTLTLPCT